MNKYTCLSCEYVFDETLGSPDKRIAPNWNALLKKGCSWHKDSKASDSVIGVAPGTKWDDVPAEFTCPSCGAPKEVFEINE